MSPNKPAPADPAGDGDHGGHGVFDEVKVSLLNYSSFGQMTILSKCASAIVAMILLIAAVSCTKHYTNIPISQLRQAPPFKAKVEKIDVQDLSFAKQGMMAIVWLKTEDGRRVAVGGMEASELMVGFAGSLHPGQTYTFPQVFLAYEESRAAPRQPPGLTNRVTEGGYAPLRNVGPLCISRLAASFPTTK